MSEKDIYECGDCLELFEISYGSPEGQHCSHCGSHRTQPFSGPDADHAAESKFIPDRAESMYCG